jgi:HIRAN domain
MPAGSSSSSDARGRLRLWLERGESGYWLRDAATGDAVRWDDERLRVVKLAGSSYRGDALQDEAFAPGRRLALVPEPENEHDPHAVGIWDDERRLHAGYVPAEIAPEVRGDEQAIALWEFRGEDGQRIGLRVLLAPADAWVQEPRS